MSVGTMLLAWCGAAGAQAPAAATDQPIEQASIEESGAAEPDAAGDPASDDDTAERLKELEAAILAQSKIINEQQKQLEELAAQAEAAEGSAVAAEELANVALTSGGAEQAIQSSSLRLYGFAEAAFTKLYIDDGSRFDNLIDGNSRFGMGNVNIYFDAMPHEEFRFLSEVRFTLYPLGDLDDNFQPIDTYTFDQTSATGRNQIPLSQIVMERAWIEWKKYDIFKIRSGLFLTPYGIWNVDHGSPTLISSVLPSFWAAEYFPTRQVGIQVLGEHFEGPWEHGYRAYVSNGRMTTQLDQDFFKSFGGRIYSAYHGDVDAQLGASMYYGQTAVENKAIISVDPFRVGGTRTEQFEDLGLAADLSVDVGDFRWRSEFVLQQREYRDGFRTPTSPVTFQRDLTQWNAYVIAAYRLPWAGLEPYTFIEYANRPLVEDESTWLYSGGLNTHLKPGTVLKFQAYYVQFFASGDIPEPTDSDFPGWDIRLVTAF